MGMIRPRPKIKSKSVTITENGESVISPDKYFNGMDKVNLTVDVAGGGSGGIDWSEIGYEGTPQSIIDGYNYAKEIQESWDSSITNMYNKYVSDKNLRFFPPVNTANVASFQNAFMASNLEFIPLIDTSDATTFQAMFRDTRIEEVPQLDTSNVTNMGTMFYGCKSLKNLPILNTSQISNSTGSFSNVFVGCESLSDDSLNNILIMCINATNVTSSNRTLKKIGLSQDQATTCQSLSNYQAFLDAGWTTGY